MIRAELSEREVRRAVGLAESGDRVVRQIAPLDRVESHSLCFANGELSDVHRERLASTVGCILLAPPGWTGGNDFEDCVVIEVPDPRAAMARVLEFVRAHSKQAPWLTEGRISPRSTVSPLSVVDPRAEIADDVVIEPFCTVAADVRIGRGSILRAGVHVYSRVVIGDETLIGANSVLGHEGYGFVRDASQNKRRIPHLAGVVIGSNVDIGALCVVQSGALAPTVIEDHAKIDDNVEVGHGAQVGRGASVTGGVVIGGSATIEDDTWVGINASIRDGRRVGKRALVGMGVTVQNDLADGTVARSSRPTVASRDAIDPTQIGFARPTKRRSSDRA